jgi:hypothetical protein
MFVLFYIIKSDGWDLVQFQEFLISPLDGAKLSAYLAGPFVTEEGTRYLLSIRLG